MTNIMTDKQIENAVNKLRDAMRKHRSEITSDVAQQVLGIENLGMMMFTPFRERAEAISSLIVRKVKVNRSRSPQKALDATNRMQETDRDVVNSMPRGKGGEVDIAFFKPEPWEYTKPGYISDDDLEKCFDRRNLKPADPFSVAAVNEGDHTFADEYPHGTHWKYEGKWCCATFRRLGDRRRRVYVDRLDCGWGDGWWFAGVRK